MVSPEFLSMVSPEFLSMVSPEFSPEFSVIMNDQPWDE